MVPEGEREDRFRIAVSILIALVAVTGALISWKISRVNDRASSFDSDAIKAALTILAVVVFLLTLSLTLSGRVRSLFSVTGILMALAIVGAIAGTVRLFFHSPPSDEVRTFARASGRLLYAQTLKLGAGQGLSGGRYLVELYVQGNLLSLGEFEIR